MSKRKILTPDKFKEYFDTSSYASTGIGDMYLLFRDHLEDILQNHPDGRVSSVRTVSFSLDYDFIAEVDRDENGQYCIFVDATVPIQFLIVNKRLLAHPNVLPIIGTPPRRHKPQSLVLLLDSPKALTEGSTQSPVIFDEKRIVTVSFLTMLALEFLVMHEVGHAVLGHRDLLNNMDSFVIPPKNIRRGLEHSADCYAIEAMLSYDYWRREKSWFNADIEPYRFRLMGFAVGTVWNILAAVTLNRGTSSPYYPKIGTRTWVVERWVESHVENRPTEVEQMRQVIEGMREAGTAWREMAWPELGCATDQEIDEGLKDMMAALQTLDEAR